jgi:hypothetical protein
MDALVKAVLDFFAGIFGGIGQVGRPRRRSAIRDDLSLLHELRDSPSFGETSQAHRHLTDHLTREVARFSGVDRRPKIKWASVVVALIAGMPAAYLTYRMNEDGFDWLSLVPGVFAFAMLGGALGLIIDPSEEEEASSESASD